MHDQLADHRIVVRRNHVARVGVRIEPHAEAAGHDHLLDLARRGLEILARILGVDAALDRRAAGHDVRLRERQRLAGGHANLRLDQVDAGDHFGHRMLDLDAGVDFDEVEVALPVDDELDRAGVGVARPP